MLVEFFSWPFSFQECVPDVRMESAHTRRTIRQVREPVTDNCPFLNQRKGDNAGRIFFMTILLPRMCAGREDGICAYQADARPTELPHPAKKFKSRRLVHTAERLALPRSVSSVRYCWRRYSSPLHKRRLVVQNHALSSSNRPDRTEILFKGASNC